VVAVDAPAFPARAAGSEDAREATVQCVQRGACRRVDGACTRCEAVLQLIVVLHGLERHRNDHAIVVRRGNEFFLDDCGSLNGTYVNRRRIESHRLTDGDELQIGKYKLAFLSR